MTKYNLNLELAEFARPFGSKDRQPRKRKFKDHLNNIASGTLNSLGLASTAAAAPLILYGIRKPKLLTKNINTPKTFYNDVKLQSMIGAGIGASTLPFNIRDKYKYEKYYKQQNLNKEKYKWK